MELKRYGVNLGRGDAEIREMKARAKDELFPVLTLDEQKSFDMQKVLNELNRVFKGVE